MSSNKVSHVHVFCKVFSYALENSKSCTLIDLALKTRKSSIAENVLEVCSSFQEDLPVPLYL